MQRKVKTKQNPKTLYNIKEKSNIATKQRFSLNISLPFNFTLMSWLAGSKGAEGAGFSILLFRILGGFLFFFFGRDEGQYSSWKWALNHFTHTPVQSSANLEFSFYWFLYQSRNFRVSLIPPLKKKQWMELKYLINYSTYTVYLCTYIHLYCYVH